MKFLVKLATWVSLLFLIVLLIFFIFRDTILDKVITVAIDKAHSKKGIILSVGERDYESFFNVSLNDISVCSPDGDTIVTVDSVFLSPRLLSFIRGNVEFSTLDIFRPVTTIYKTSERDNISFLLKEEKTERDSSVTGGMAGAMKNLMELFFSQIPDEMRVMDMQIYAEIKDKKVKIRLPDSFIHNDAVTAVLELPSDSIYATYVFTGSVNRDEHKVSGSLYSKSEQQLVPFLKKYYDLALKADTLHFTFEESDPGDDLFGINGSLVCKGFFAENWRIAPEPVRIDRASIDYNFIFSDDSLYLDSSSSIRIDQITIHPYLAIKRGKQKTYTLDLTIPEMKADSFFSSLPEGIFEHTRTIRANGYLSYRMHFRYDESKLDSLRFSSKMTKRDFKITDYGKTDPRKMNGEFSYTAYEKNRPVRSFMVGPSNPTFTPLAGISPYLVASVMTSEDGNFYYHGGFNEDAFRKSIIENIRERRFKRGGSTISMQLVKNVFLTRNKNISRKVEEAMLTWLIESNRLVSKQRMLEVYLNIIEWGPGIFGVGEAARFYFDKSPAELDLNESIFLAMIVPQPKGFRYHFDDHAHLKPHCQAYYNLLAKHLVKKNVITEEQQQSILADVKLAGPAAGMVKTVTDSLPQDEPELRELELRVTE